MILDYLVKVLIVQLCLTLCNHVDYSPPGSSVHGILQARILEWVAVPSSRGSSWPRDQTWVSCIAGRFFTAWELFLKSHSVNDFRSWPLFASQKQRGVKPGLVISFLFDIIHVSMPFSQNGRMREGGERGVQDGEHMYTRGRFMSMYGKMNTIS